LFGGDMTPVATGLFLTPGDVKLNTHQTGGGSFLSHAAGKICSDGKLIYIDLLS